MPEVSLTAPLFLPLSPLSASEGGSSWAVRSKCALLVAEIARQGGTQVWEVLLPALLQAAEEGPGAATSCLTVLRHVTEDVTVFADDLQGSRAPFIPLPSSILFPLRLFPPFPSPVLHQSALSPPLVSPSFLG